MNLPKVKLHRQVFEAHRSSRMVAYLCTLAALLASYLLAWWTHQPPVLAVGMAAVAATAAFVSCRAIQSGGRTAGFWTLLGLPLLLAATWVAFFLLSPFMDRQRVVEDLTQTGLEFSARTPDVTDEWVSDRSGNGLPVWLANTLGAHCLSEITRIEGTLRDLRSIDYQRIDTSQLSRLRLTTSKNCRLDPHLVSWINAAPRLRHLDFYLKDFSSSDAELLRDLDRGWGATIQLNDSSVGLASLSETTPEWLNILTPKLTALHAKDLSRLQRQEDGLSRLQITCEQISFDAIQALRSAPDDSYIVNFTSTQIDAQGLQCIAQLNRSRMEFQQLDFPFLAQELEAGVPRPVSTSLAIRFCSATAEQCVALAGLFRCQYLGIYTNSRIDFPQQILDSIAHTTDLTKLQMMIVGPEIIRETVWNRPDSD